MTFEPRIHAQNPNHAPLPRALLSELPKDADNSLSAARGIVICLIAVTPFWVVAALLWWGLHW
jgi:hypothetical protein